MTGPHVAGGQSHPSPESPSELLERAALLLEDRACGATPGPWTLWDRGVGWEINELPDVHDGTTFTEADARWAAMMNPLVTPPLVAWLRRVRDMLAFWEQHERNAERVIRFQAERALGVHAAALEFAHLILATKDGEKP